MLTGMHSRFILGTRVDATSYQEAARRVVVRARQGRSCYVCCSNVHTVMEGYDHAEFRTVVNGAEVVTPDGMPLVWGLRLLGLEATRVYGPDLTCHLLEVAAREGDPVGFYGGSPAALAALLDRAGRRFSGVQIRYAFSPPFAPLSPEQDERITAEINASGAQILFVGLGCPNQERWMAAHRGRVRAVMLGVGAAFDFLSGAKRQAPRWMQRAGLEWLFRLLSEPARLWRRYLWHIPRFVALFALQLLGWRRFAPPEAR